MKHWKRHRNAYMDCLYLSKGSWSNRSFREVQIYKEYNGYEVQVTDGANVLKIARCHGKTLDEAKKVGKLLLLRS